MQRPGRPGRPGQPLEYKTMKHQTTASTLVAVAMTGVLGLAAAAVLAGDSPPAVGAAIYTEDGQLRLPEQYREWVFIGAPLTPNALNGGEAAFPEFHHVYVNPDAYAVYRLSGEFPDGTVIVKELLLLQGDQADGTSVGPSGRGYFAGDYHGLDVMVKDGRRYAATAGWGFFNFGHHAPPYQAAAAAAPEESCAGCHRAVQKSDMVFKQYYPALK